MRMHVKLSNALFFSVSKSFVVSKNQGEKIIFCLEGAKFVKNTFEEIDF